METINNELMVSLKVVALITQIFHTSGSCCSIVIVNKDNDEETMSPIITIKLMTPLLSLQYRRQCAPVVSHQCAVCLHCLSPVECRCLQCARGHSFHRVQPSFKGWMLSPPQVLSPLRRKCTQKEAAQQRGHAEGRGNLLHH